MNKFRQFRTGLSFALLGGFLLLSHSPAIAVDYLASIGEVVTISGHAVPAQTGDGFLLDALANRSYSCEGIPSLSDSQFAFSDSVVGTLADAPETIPARPTGSMAPMITGGIGYANKTRLTFRPTTNDRFRIAVESAKEGGEDVRVHCVETSLYGGYNTSVNNFNFLELRNLSTAPIAGKMTAVDFRGEIVAEHEFVIPAGRRRDFDLHTAVGPGSYGAIRVVHNGPHRALTGRVSFYTGDVRHFVLRGSVRLHPALNYN